MTTTFARMVKVARAHGCTRRIDRAGALPVALADDYDDVTLHLLPHGSFHAEWRRPNGTLGEMIGNGVTELCQAFVVAWREMGR